MATDCRSRINKRIDFLKSQGTWSQNLRGSKSVKEMPRATVLPVVSGLTGEERKYYKHYIAFSYKILAIK